MMELRGTNGHSYRLEEKPFSSGGEGDVFGIVGNADKVVKVYHRDRISIELENKLILMASNPPSSHVLSQVAWPLDVVYDSSNRFVGFVMPRLSITAELNEVYVYPPRTNITTKQKLILAQNICVVISEVHKAGYVFGDFNPRNIGINTNTGTVAFLDTDSYHIVVDKATNKAYRCSVCAPGYAAPELLEKCAAHIAAHPEDSKQAYAKTPLDTFTKETDNFALAIHLFKLLMNGYTPFGGIKESESASVGSPGVGDAAVRRDSYCFKPGNKPQSAAVPPLDILPQEIADLFTRAFMYGRIDPKQRPNAVEWHKALGNYEASLKTCAKNPAHMYMRSLSSCPWCEADDKYEASIAPPIKQKTFSAPVTPNYSAIHSSLANQITGASTSGSQSNITGSSTSASAGSTYSPPVKAVPQVKTHPVRSGIIGFFAGDILGAILSYMATSNSSAFFSILLAIIGAIVAINIDNGNIKINGKRIRLGFLGIVGLIILIAIIRSCSSSQGISTGSSNSQTQSAQNQGTNAVDNGEGELEAVQLNGTFLSDLDWSGSSEKSGALRQYDSAKDNFGTTYSNALGGRSSDNWNEYTINKRYSRLSGRVILNYEYRTGTSENTYVKIYGDDVLLFTSELVTGGMEPQDFSVDISTVDILKVSVRGENYIRLVDCVLSEDIEGDIYSSAVQPNPFDGRETIYLSDLDWFNSSESSGALRKYESAKDNYGTTYSNALGGRSTENWSDYKLNGQISTLAGRIILNYDYRTATSDNTYVKIYGDDVLLFTSELVTAGVEPQDFSVDLTNVDKLRVYIRGQNYIRLVDSTLSKGDSSGYRSSALNADAGKAQVNLSDLDWFNSSDSSGAFREYTTAKDNFSTTYSSALGGRSTENWCEYKVGSKYAVIQGRVVLNYEYRTSTSDDSHVRIYGDGTLLFTSENVSAGMEPQDFSVNITGVDVLRVYIRGQNYIRLTDCILYKDTPTSIYTSAAPMSFARQVFLGDLVWYNSSNSSGLRTYNSASDNVGGKYSNGVGGRSSSTWCDYRLNGEFSSFSGRVILNNDYATRTANNSYVKIYCDGNLVYNSPLVVSGMQPSDFNIDLTGVKTLRVSIDGENLIRIVDCYLNK